MVETLRSRGVPFVLATGYGAAAAAGMDGVLVIEKPFTQDRLESALTTALAAADRNSTLETGRGDAPA